MSGKFLDEKMKNKCQTSVALVIVKVRGFKQYIFLASVGIHGQFCHKKSINISEKPCLSRFLVSKGEIYLLEMSI